MKLAIGGICANLIAIMGIYINASETGSEQFAMYFTLFALAFWVLSLIGLILMSAGDHKLGGILIIIGAIFFVPLGLIAILGARAVMSGGQDLNERRRLASAASDPVR